MRTIHSKSEMPDGPHFAILEFTSVTIPGDERSRDFPGHGYPEHTDHYCNYIVCDDEAEWKGEISHRMGLIYSSRDFVPIRVTPASVKTEYTITVS